jgi:hypothetical protein
VRGAIDSLVQSSLVQLFSAYGIAVAPQPRVPLHRALPLPEVSAAVIFTRRDRAVHPGRLTLSLPPTLLEQMIRGAGSALKNDWARELTNQLAGRVKNRLLQFGIRLEMGISLMVDSKSLAPQLQLMAEAPGTRTYAGRTLRGDLVVTMTGAPDESELRYVGPSTVASEGDTILF